MRVRSLMCAVIMFAACLAALRPASAGDWLRYGRWRAGPEWNTNYYDTAWGMPLAVVVPPTARWQSNYSWGVGGYRLDYVGARYQAIVPGPVSAYDPRYYLPAPPQPSDTIQFGDNYVRGPRP